MAERQCSGNFCSGQYLYTVRMGVFTRNCSITATCDNADLASSSIGGKGIGTKALCLISNMSSEAIYIQHLVAVLHTREGVYELDVVEYQQQSGDDNEECYRTHQGPLASGDYLHIQSFGSIVDQLVQHWKLDQGTLQEQTPELEIRVIAIYGSEDMPVGASRRFALDLNADPLHQLTPLKVDTERMNSRRDRKRVLEWAKAIEMHKAQ